MAFCAVFCIPSGRMSILTAFGLSMLAGQGAAVYTFTKNLKQADEYLELMEKYPDILVREKIIPLLSNGDEETVYNVKNYIIHTFLKLKTHFIFYSFLFLILSEFETRYIKLAEI